MISYSTEYINNILLNKFIKEKKIPNTKKVLCQIFTSFCDKAYIKNLTNELKTILTNINIIGTTTDGEISNGLVSTGKTILSFTIFEKSEIKTYITEDFENYKEAGEKLIKDLDNDKLKLIISFIDGLHSNGDNFLSGISNINSEVRVAGGLAGDNGEFKETFIFTDEKIYTRGVLGAGISSYDLKVYTEYDFNWLAIGKDLIITKCEGSKVYSICNKSAYETYKYYLGEEVANGLPGVGVEFPLVIQRNGLNIARAVLRNNNDGSLTFGGNFQEGDVVKFAYGDAETILNNCEINTKKFENLHIEGVFLYSCMARRRFLSKNIEQETMPYNSIAPTSGFFSYGEFYTNKCSEFLNQTMTILALSESAQINKNNENIKFKKNKITNTTMKALSHLINVTTNELEEQKNIAIEANKIKDKFLANMSHELKTPLNSINIISAVMKKNRLNNLNEQQIKNLTIINKSGDFLLHMINDVLDISKLESGNMNINIDKVNINHLIKEIIEMFKPQFQQKEIKLTYSIDETLNFIYSDEIRIKQILKNLISNALKFTHKGSVKLLVKDKNEEVIFLVEDQGIGIEKDKLEFIFDRFKQADDTTTKKYGGTGLGLSISKELIKLLKGDISVQSIINIGTKIKVTLPKNNDYVLHLDNLDLRNAKEKKDKKLVIFNDDPIYFFDLILKLQKDFELIQITNKNELLNINLNDKKSKVVINLAKLEKQYIDKLIEKLGPNLIILDEKSSTNYNKDKISVINKSQILNNSYTIKE